MIGSSARDETVGEVGVSGGGAVNQAKGRGADYRFKLPVPGGDVAMNALAVLAVANALGADPEMAAQDIAQWLPPAGRGTREVVALDPGSEEETIDLIDDAFNANPTSMAAAFEILAAATPRDGIGRIVKGRRVAILGDMLELGPDETAMHRGLAGDPHLQMADIIHCAGPRMRALYDALPRAKQGRWAEQAAELASAANHLVDAGDVVLVKGSKGSKVSGVVDAIRKLGHR